MSQSRKKDPFPFSGMEISDWVIYNVAKIKNITFAVHWNLDVLVIHVSFHASV